MKYLLIIFVTLFSLNLSLFADDLQSLDKLVRQWVDLRTQLAAEKQNWQQQQQQLNREIDILSKESKRLDELIQANQSSRTTNANYNASQTKKLKQIEKQLIEIDAYTTNSIQQIRQIQPLIPPPLQTQNFKTLLNLQKNMPRHQRTQLLTTVLTEIDQIENKTHCINQIIKINNRRRAMDVVYLGLARAFAVAPDNSISAIGMPAKSGWQWTPTPKLSANIRKMVEIVRSKAPPQLTIVPINAERVHNE